MAFADSKNRYPVVGNVTVAGRPDLHNPKHGVTHASRHPPYVFSVRGGSALIHKVRWVELHWWKVSNSGDRLIRVARPLAIAETICGQSFRLEASASRTCRVPKPDALLCGRCHGRTATFARGQEPPMTRQAAHVKLGCVVNGYRS